MNPQITMIVMLAVTLGAALYVAWPLLFGRVRPEQHLEPEYAEPALEGGPERRAAAPRVRRRPSDSDGAIDLDLEQEIEAFRRKRGTAVASGLACPSCGRHIADREAAFCSKCGAPVGDGSGARGKRTGKTREGR